MAPAWATWEFGRFVRTQSATGVSSRSVQPRRSRASDSFAGTGLTEISSILRSRSSSSVLWRRAWSGTHPTRWVNPCSQRLTSNPSIAAVKVGLSLPLTTTSKLLALKVALSGVVEVLLVERSAAASAQSADGEATLHSGNQIIRTRIVGLIGQSWWRPSSSPWWDRPATVSSPWEGDVSCHLECQQAHSGSTVTFVAH
jgi:hypothetical protein